jgi:hypothetical protein
VKAVSTVAMGAGGTFLQVLSSDSLSAPLSSITDEPDKYDSSTKTFSISRPSSVYSAQISEASDDSGTSFNSSGVVGSHISDAKVTLTTDDITRSNDAEPSSASPTTEDSSAFASQAIHAVSPHTKPLTPPAPLVPLVIPKRGPLAAIVRSESLPDSPGSSISGVIDLTHQIKTLSTYAFAHGGFADIHWAEWERRSEDGKIKSVRMSATI